MFYISIFPWVCSVSEDGIYVVSTFSVGEQWSPHAKVSGLLAGTIYQTLLDCSKISL